MTQILDLVYFLVFFKDMRVPLSGKSMKLTFGSVHFNNASSNNQKHT